MNVELIISYITVISGAIALLFWGIRLNKRQKAADEWAELLHDQDRDIDEKYDKLNKSIDLSNNANRREIVTLIDSYIGLRDQAVDMFNSTELLGEGDLVTVAKNHLSELVNKTQGKITVLEEFHFYTYGYHHTLPYHLSKFPNGNNTPGTN